MTMQVGFVVAGGIVLAGDKHWTFEPLLDSGMGWPGVDMVATLAK